MKKTWEQLVTEAHKTNPANATVKFGNLLLRLLPMYYARLQITHTKGFYRKKFKTPLSYALAASKNGKETFSAWAGKEFKLSSNTINTYMMWARRPEVYRKEKIKMSEHNRKRIYLNNVNCLEVAKIAFTRLTDAEKWDLYAFMSPRMPGERKAA